MSDRILVCVAWPYANGPLHLGHVAGCYLPADIFARYQRACGHEVLMVSGSDQHGTPITVRAEQEGRTPQEVANFYHHQFLDCWQELGISFDLFTSTGTANHAEVTHYLFRTLLEKGYLYRDTMPLLYCPRCQRFLADRYVLGTCPHCGFTDTRGDQCDRCGRPLNTTELIAPRCRFCGTQPEIRNSEHCFFRLSAFQDRLLDWVRQQSHWRPNVLHFTLRYLNEGLKDRAITRDLEWGVAVPLPGFEKKRIYVWFEAVIGYLSATQECLTRRGEGEHWRDFWQKPCRSYYFIGKDNILFHTLIWPAMLLGHGGLNLPYDVPANEFLNLEGRPFSTSRNWAVWLPDYLEGFDPDPLRYFISATMPETGDADFSWREFFRRNNDELVATYGNLVHRVLTFTYRHFEGQVPVPGEYDEASRALLSQAEETLGKVGELLGQCHFSEALRTAMGLAQQANRYLDVKAPWKTISEQRQEAALSLYVALSVINSLKTILYPFLPFSSQKLHRFLGFSGRVEEGRWVLSPLPPGQALVKPEPLFVKLEEKVIEERRQRLGKAAN